MPATTTAPIPATSPTTSAPPQTFQNILYEKKDAGGGATGSTFAHITINRPKVLNALNKATIAELRRAFEDARDDESVRGVILTGAGEKSFAAGADISEMAAATPIQTERKTAEGQAVTVLIENLGKPVIAAVNGFALGGGCELAMACTIRIAADHAKFGQPEVKIGLIPGYGGTQRLPRLVGKGRALQLILTGDTIGADEALRIGLVNEVVPQAILIARAEDILRRISANAPQAVRLAIEAANKGFDMTLAEGLTLESSLVAICAATSDLKEGATAFLEKRPPRFQGR